MNLHPVRRLKIRSRCCTILRRFGWHMSKHDPWPTGRIYALIRDRHHWYDWGHPLMIITGTARGGNYDTPQPSTWWYHPAEPRRMWRTGYPRGRYTIVKSYTEMRTATKGLNEDQLYHWRAIATDQDNELVLGRMYWGDRFYGLAPAETAILRRWLRHWHLQNWFGLRSWLYTQALHAAVHQRKPFSCATTPTAPHGYSHWHCQLRRNHPGLHRYNAMVWGQIDGEDIGLVHLPADDISIASTR